MLRRALLMYAATDVTACTHPGHHHARRSGGAIVLLCARHARITISRCLVLDLRLIDVGIEQRIDVGTDIRPDAHHPAFAVRIFVD